MMPCVKSKINLDNVKEIRKRVVKGEVKFRSEGEDETRREIDKLSRAFARCRYGGQRREGGPALWINGN
jgi:hypothetical protein